MKTYRVEFTPDARQDILDYARFIAQQEHDNHQALAWIDGIEAAMMSLAELPKRCGLARENDHFDEEIRQLTYASHRAVFSVHDDLRRVVIHRVWHTARDELAGKDLPALHEGGKA